jgi:hypothetical protein
MRVPIEIWEIWAGMAALAVGGIALSRYLTRKRGREFEQAAMQMGFAYQLEDKPIEPADEARFHLFSQGHGRKFRNVARGGCSAGEVVLFDYQYTVGSGKNSHTYCQTVALFRWPGTSLPGFTLAHERWWHKVGTAFGYQDLDFDSNPEFSRRFLLRGADEEAIRQFFTPPVLAFFESRDSAEAWTWEGAGDKLLLYTQGRKVKPADLPMFLQEAASASSQLRSYSPARRLGF